jgi:hypothetical protein
VLDALLAAHRLWVEWLEEGRVRKLALVAELAEDGRCRDPDTKRGLTISDEPE